MLGKIWNIAVREFVAIVLTKAFIIGLLVLPATIALFALLGPRLFSERAYDTEGELAVIDKSGGRVIEELRAAPAPRELDVDAALRIASGSDDAPQRIAEALGAAARIALVERPAASDVEAEKAWLLAEPGEGAPRHLALAVIHENAVAAAGAGGSFDLYVPPKQDYRVEAAVQQRLRDAIVAARLRASGLDRAAIDQLTSVPRVRSVTVADDGERRTVGAFAVMLPLAFMMLLFLGVMGSGQGLLISTIEEKSSRVVEVLLSAVSPLELMAGKLLGHMAASLLAMSLYLALGLATLASFSLFGLLELSLVGYLVIFFLIAYFTVGSLMMAIGAAVNDPREAQSLMMPITLVLVAPWLLWMPISRDPDSTLALLVSLVPPMNTFGMMLRLASTSPPPVWQVWLSIALGCAGVLAAIWLAAKVFRIGLLMFGKAPDFATLMRWLRAA